jgi:hypothetical protein
MLIKTVKQLPSQEQAAAAYLDALLAMTCPTFFAVALMAGPLAKAAGVRAGELTAGAAPSCFCRFCTGPSAEVPAAAVVFAAPVLRLAACCCC